MLQLRSVTARVLPLKIEAEGRER